MLSVAVSHEQLEAELAAGVLACPGGRDGCRGGGTRARARCARAWRTVAEVAAGVLAGLWRDARAVSVVVGSTPARRAQVIGEALALAAGGDGHRRITRRLGGVRRDGPRVTARRQGALGEAAIVRRDRATDLAARRPPGCVTGVASSSHARRLGRDQSTDIGAARAAPTQRPCRAVTLHAAPRASVSARRRDELDRTSVLLSALQELCATYLRARRWSGRSCRAASVFKAEPAEVLLAASAPRAGPEARRAGNCIDSCRRGRRRGGYRAWW
jgi:hypothetical protein